MTTIEEFMQWFANNDLSKNRQPYILEKLSLKFDKESGYGFKIEQFLTEKEPLFRIPSFLLLNHLSCMKHLLCDSEGQVHVVLECDTGKFPDDRFEIFTMSYFKKIKISTPINMDEIWVQYSKFSPSDLLNLSSFQLVTMYLCLEEKRGVNSFWYNFLELLPKDFGCLPLSWAASDEKQYLLETLPLYIHRKVMIQLDQFNMDYNTVKVLLKNKNIDLEITKPQFLNKWLCINSRCLYYQLPSTILFDKSISDNFTLCPLVDFINHCDDQDKSATIRVNGYDSFDVVAPEVGVLLENGKVEELFFSYGAHPNSFLLTEYGFVLPDGYNRFETVDITDQITKKLNKDQVLFLKENDYFGEYTFTEDYLSFRTIIVLTLLTTQNERKTLHLLNGIIDENLFQYKNNQLLHSVLINTLQLFHDKLLLIESIDICDTNVKTTLYNFYKFQIRICDHWLDEIKSQRKI